MEQLKQMKSQLTSLVQGQMCDTSKVDAKELGEAVDMIKDLSEAIYYCTITKAMEETEHEPNKPVMYYTDYKYNPDYYRDFDMDRGRRYYSAPLSTPVRSSYNPTQSSRMFYPDFDMDHSRMHDDSHMRDDREGRSPIQRKYYMEMKENKDTKENKVKGLEKYMNELSKDMTEMIEGATAEEREILRQKIVTLANKI